MSPHPDELIKIIMPTSWTNATIAGDRHLDVVNWLSKQELLESGSQEVGKKHRLSSALKSFSVYSLDWKDADELPWCHNLGKDISLPNVSSFKNLAPCNEIKHCTRRLILIRILIKSSVSTPEPSDWHRITDLESFFLRGCQNFSWLACCLG